MNLLSIAHVPPAQVSPDDTVMKAIDVSLPQRVGAVAVVEKGRLVGIFTERDVMLKVVHGRLDPETTTVGSVMTAPVMTVPPEAEVADVLRLMVEKHIRHLPISRDGRGVEGMLSIRNVLQFMVEDLQSNLHHMEAYITADSPGG
jgi:CBS domain-containing protein